MSVYRPLFVCFLATSLVHAPAQAAPPGHGCFKVTAAVVNIRDGAFSSSNVVGSAGRGEILVKRKRFCTLRGFWCAVRKGSIEGWADTAFMERVDCRGRLSEDD